jgi:hypothetical protein
VKDCGGAPGGALSGHRTQTWTSVAGHQVQAAVSQTGGHEKGGGQGVMDSGDAPSSGGGGGLWGGVSFAAGTSSDSASPTFVAASRSSSVPGFAAGSKRTTQSGIVFVDHKMVFGGGPFLSPAGSPETGHAGNGFARITMVRPWISCAPSSKFLSIVFFFRSLLDPSFDPIFSLAILKRAHNSV